MSRTSNPKPILDGDLLPSQAELSLMFSECPNLHDSSREFLFALMEAIEGLTPAASDEATGLSMSKVCYAILSGTAPGVDVIVTGDLSGTGAFTLRVGGSFILDLVVVRWNGEGLSWCIGDQGTILRYRGPGDLRQGCGDYSKALQIIRAVIDGGGVFLCRVSGDWRNHPPQNGDCGSQTDSTGEVA